MTELKKKKTCVSSIILTQYSLDSMDKSSSLTFINRLPTIKIWQPLINCKNILFHSELSKLKWTDSTISHEHLANWTWRRIPSSPAAYCIFFSNRRAQCIGETGTKCMLAVGKMEFSTAWDNTFGSSREWRARSIPCAMSTMDNSSEVDDTVTASSTTPTAPDTKGAGSLIWNGER